jgi:signal recognition particle receptor subunit beta
VGGGPGIYPLVLHHCAWAISLLDIIDRLPAYEDAPQSAALVFVVDACSRDAARNVDAKKYLDMFFSSPEGSHLPVLIFVNKCDEEHPLSQSEVTDMLELERWNAKHWYVQVSVCTGCLSES